MLVDLGTGSEAFAAVERAETVGSRIQRRGGGEMFCAVVGQYLMLAHGIGVWLDSRVWFVRRGVGFTFEYVTSSFKFWARCVSVESY